ncbi:cell surface receptor IPT/TIG and fibronectin domain-containing protein [Clostridium putrefaciens]|uniref:Cell surface receptor IPT/TIG and fibronectin domain-containing protein n=1 Tax=Clostridium putrefaciens TaxID=99675 RepID=A0A381J906_9CLOT|nr:IPT/TIG domain-containing protein [Clostridium putrefaciens]SUY47493.1 cell surface receptor IPT/TIG and fibronectin domain-containing protein [Clostridium putrefaciens]
MRKVNKKVVSIFILSVFFFNALFANVSFTANAAVDTVKISKEIEKDTVTHGEEINVTVNVKGTPPPNTVMPNDVILIIDKSGSMNGQKIEDARESAKAFVDLMDMTKHRVGIVDFSFTQNIGSLPLTNDPLELKSYISGIKSGGGTHTGSAIAKATEMLQGHREDAQPVIIIMTDGAANYGGSEEAGFRHAKEAAAVSKDAGIIFYTIALLDQGNNPLLSPQNNVLKEMATTSQHHHFVLGSVGLNEIYKSIVKEIGIASAYDLTIKDVVSPEFEIVPGSYDTNIPKPTVNGNEISWHLLELKDQQLSFNYKIRVKNLTSLGKYPVSLESDVNYKDFAGAKKTINFNIPKVSVEYNAPTITTVTPDNGDVAGGNEIIIKGTNFKSGVKVYFDSTLAAKVDYVSENEIRAIVPEGKQKAVDLKVVNIDKKSAKSSYLYWTKPEVTSIAPNKGLVTGNTTVTIRGNHFLNGVKVKIGNKEAKKVIYKNPTLIYALTDEVESPGMVDVTVTNPDKDESTITVADGFTYEAEVLPAPVMTRITPSEGFIDESNSVAITGKNFKSGAKVYFGVNEATDVVIVDSNKITANVPKVNDGQVVDVKVINPDMQEANLLKAYTYKIKPVIIPAISSITPNNAYINEEVEITIKGENFEKDCKVFIDNTESNILNFSANSLKVKVPVSDKVKSVDVKVINPDAKEAISVNGFDYKDIPSPEIISLSPNKGVYNEEGKVITIYGSGFEKGAKVKFGNKDGLNISVNSATNIRVTVPTVDKVSVVDVVVINPNGKQVKLDNGYNYIPTPEKLSPEITSITPNSIIFNETNERISIYGKNFQSGVKVRFGDKEGLDISLNSEKYLRVTVPTVEKPGEVDVTVINPDGKEIKLVNGFNYKAVPEKPAPEITSITPSSVIYNEKSIISIYGQSFQKGAKVKFGDQEALNVTLSGETHLRVTVPTVDKPVIVDVTVINPDGKEIKLVDGLSYIPVPAKPAPEVISITPNSSIYNNGNQTISIYGKNFQDGAEVKFGDKKSLNVKLYGSKHLRVIVPATDKPNIVDVTVINPDGQEVKVDKSYNYNDTPSPEITSYKSKESIYNEDNNTIYIYGIGFEPGIQAKIGGKDSLKVTFVNDKQIRVLIPKADSPGLADIMLINPDGKTGVVEKGYNYLPIPEKPAPKITTITPNSIIYNETNKRITIYGSDFQEGVKVRFGDKEGLDVALNSATYMRVTVPTSDKIGAVDITIINPDGKEVKLSSGFDYKPMPEKPAPVITTITPNSVVYNETNKRITIYGKDFQEGVKVKFGDKDGLDVALNSATYMRVTIPTSDKVGLVDVRVINPDGKEVKLINGFNYIALP